jgi:hypothetical protein
MMSLLNCKWQHASKLHGFDVKLTLNVLSDEPGQQASDACDPAYVVHDPRAQMQVIQSRFLISVEH